MNNKKTVIILLVVIIFTNILSIKITSLFIASQEDMDYQKLNLEIKDYDIDYYTTYYKDISCEYKVYKIDNSYKGDSIDNIKEQLEHSNVWNRKKFYEYIMMKFYERVDGKITEIDREDLYYYNKGLIYAIIDVKNAKLYYLKNNMIDYHNDYDEILGIKINNYTDMEIYSVKGQNTAQDDGIDYYTYKFNEEKGKDIEKNLSKSQIWNTEKLDNEILNCFEYNSEVLNVQNGYYCYKKVYQNNSYKNVNNSRKETGYEVGVYDCDKNILYYYWRSI